MTARAARLEARNNDCCLFFQSGFLGADSFMRLSIKANCTYMGCSYQSVPSLSNTAIRWYAEYTDSRYVGYQGLPDYSFLIS